MSRETILLRLSRQLQIAVDDVRISIGDLGKPELPTDIVIGQWRLLLTCVIYAGMLNAQAVYRFSKVN